MSDPVICRSCGQPIHRATKGAHATCFSELRVPPTNDREQYVCDLRVGDARCGGGSSATGWCGKHSRKFYRYGHPLHVEKKLTPCHYCPSDMPIEKSKRVGKDNDGYPLCRKHYTRWKTYGDPLKLTRREPTMEHTPENFWALVDTQGGDVSQCWHWQGTISVHGYGVWQKTPAHRTALLLSGGGHPVGNVVDHRCHDPRVCTDTRTCTHRSCCNPTHLKSVTTAENVSAERAIKPSRIDGACSVECCDKGAQHRHGVEQLCSGHSQRYRKHGADFPRTPLRVLKPRRTTLPKESS